MAAQRAAQKRARARAAGGDGEGAGEGEEKLDEEEVVGVDETEFGVESTSVYNDDRMMMHPQQVSPVSP